MAKINLTASTYRVARGKAEIAKEAKWLKKAQLTTKKNQELKKTKPAEKPAAEDQGSSDQDKATEIKGPGAPDND